jgi:hypothetical protein
MMIVVIWWECSWTVVYMMVVEVGRRDCWTVVNKVIVSRRVWIWVIVYVMVVEIWWGCSRPVVHLVIAELVAWGVVVVDVRPVDASCYVVPILQIVITALVVVR